MAWTLIAALENIVDMLKSFFVYNNSVEVDKTWNKFHELQIFLINLKNIITVR